MAGMKFCEADKNCSGQVLVEIKWEGDIFLEYI